MAQPATASAGPAETLRFGCPAAARQSSAGGRARQPQLSVRDRQRMHLLFQRVEQERRNGTGGAIHSVKYHFAGNNTSVEITYDDGRHGDAAGGDNHSSSANRRATRPAPTQQQNSPQERQPVRERPLRQRAGGNGRPSNAVAAHKAPRQTEPDSLAEEMAFADPTDEELQQLADTVNNLTRVQVRAMEKQVKGVITSVVRSLGGDERTGGRYLDEPVALDIGDHRINLRLPTGSIAANKTAEDFAFLIMETYFDSSRTERARGEDMRQLLLPRDPE